MIQLADEFLSIEELRNILITEKMTCGDVILENAAGTGVKVIATADLDVTA